MLESYDVGFQTLYYERNILFVTIETLVVTMQQKDHSLVQKMNIQTDAIIGNQCDDYSTDDFIFDEKKITFLNTKTRGVGINRNLVFDHATGDYCVLADDDMRFVNGYPEIARKAIKNCPKADIIIFNLIEKENIRYKNKKIQRIRCFNYGKYGAARIVVKKSSVIDSGLRFNLNFGGGTRYLSGEDTIFLKDCLKRKLKIYAVPYALAELHQTQSSSWKKGPERFFFDKGALYRCLHPLLFVFYEVFYLLRHRKEYIRLISLNHAFFNMLEGGKDYVKNGNYKI